MVDRGSETTGRGRARRTASHATVAATAFVVGAAATAGASQLINGHNIKPGSIPEKALTAKARKELKGARGSKGAQGPSGPLLIEAALNPADEGVETEFVSPATGVVADTTVTSVSEVPVPVALKVHSLAVALSEANPEGVSAAPLTFTLYANGDATALTCTVALNKTRCTDATHKVAVPAGDELSLKVTVGVGKHSIPELTAGISLDLDPS